MDRRERDLRRICKKYGVELRRGTKHYKLVDERGAILHVAATSGSKYTLTTTEAQLRRMKRS